MNRHASVRRFWPALLALPWHAAIAAPFAYVGGIDHLTLVDTATDTIAATIPIPGPCLSGIAVNGAGTRVYAGCVFSFKVSVVDTASNTVAGSIPLENGMSGIAVNDAGTRAYATISSSNVVSVIDTTSNTVITDVAVGKNPDGLAVDPSGSRVYVANLLSSTVSVIDTASNAVVATIAVGSSPVGVAVNRAGTQAYVTNSQSNSVSIIDTATQSIVATVPVGLRPTGVSANSSGTRVYVVNNQSNNVSVIDTGTNIVVATIGVGANPLGIALNPTDTRAYVPSSDSNNISAIDTASNAVIATLPAGAGCCLAFGQFIMPAPAPGSANYQGLWWLPSESGWGVNVAHQADTIFASWFTYDTTGKGWWLVMTAPKTATDVYSGRLLATHGPRFDAFDTTKFQYDDVGAGTLTFTDANNGTFRYVIGAVDQTKAITRQVFGPLPTCSYGTQPDLALATNYQDLWWAKPGGSESGWGVNVNHQGNTIFATWFTYDVDGTPMWLVASAPQSAPGVYSGDLLRTHGPRYDAYDATQFKFDKVGTATLSFADGNNASFHYDMTGVAPALVSQTKPITRQVFAGSGTTCH